MTTLFAAGGAIVGAWFAMLGTAALCRRARVGRTASIVIALACYAGLATAAFAVLGTGWQGFAGAGGMLLPCAVAVALTALL